MAPEKFHNRYRISSARASWNGYDGGGYFVTICTAHRQHFFGEIYDGEMHLTAIGQIVAKNLQTVSEHYQYAEIPLYVIMPNHLHAIVLIDRKKIPSKRHDNSENTDNKNHMIANIVSDDCIGAARHVYTGEKNAKMHEIANQSGWFSVCIAGIKSAITKSAHENNIDFDWQSRFHDHIIRDTAEMNCITFYIQNNISRWDLDCFNNN